MKKLTAIIAALAALLCFSACEKNDEPSWDVIIANVTYVSDDMCTINLSVSEPIELGEGNKVTLIAMADNKADVSKWTNLNSTRAASIEPVYYDFTSTTTRVEQIWNLTPETTYYIYVTLVAEDQTILKISKPIVITTTKKIEKSEEGY